MTTMIKLLPTMFEALYRGHRVDHVVGWKWAGVLTSGVTAVLSLLSGVAVVSGWIPAEIPPETIMAASSFIVSVIAGLLGYVTVATTNKIGLEDRDGGDSVE
jgi:hypothetical protein